MPVFQIESKNVYALRVRKISGVGFVHTFKYLVKFPTQITTVTFFVEDKRNVFCFLLPKTQLIAEGYFLWTNIPAQLHTKQFI